MIVLRKIFFLLLIYSNFYRLLFPGQVFSFDKSTRTLSDSTRSRLRQVGNITINSKNIYEASDDFIFSGLVNSLHIPTRNQIIRQELLFHSNEPFNPGLVYESERNLRALGIFSDVNIEPFYTDSNNVHVAITTRDKWTTQLRTLYKLEGNVHTFGIGISEDNLLGFGKSLDLSYDHSSERITRQLQWRDHRLFGSRIATLIKYRNDTDLRTFDLLFSRPFYAWHSKWGFNFSYKASDGITRQYKNGQFISSLPTKDRYGQFYVSMYWGQYIKQHFMIGAIHEKFKVGDQKRKSNLVGIGFGIMKRDYFETENINTHQIVEDIPSGYSAEIAAALNYKDEIHNFHQPYILYHIVWANAVKNKSSFFLSSFMQTFFDQYHRKDMYLENELVFYKPIPQQLLVTRLRWSKIVNPSTFHDMILDEENGLRGYKLYSRTGTTLLLYNLENRINTNIKIFFLRLGFTCFVDVGEAWEEDEEIQFDHLKSSLGFGLRLGYPKFSTGITRIDFAYNLDEKIWRISISSGSYFSAFIPLSFLNDFRIDQLR